MLLLRAWEAYWMDMGRCVEI